MVGMLNRLPSEARRQLSSLGYVADAPVPYPLFAALTGLEEEELDRLILECHRHSILSLVDKQAVAYALTIAAINATNEEGILEDVIKHSNDGLSESRANLAGLRLEIVHYERILQHARDILGTEDISVLGLASSLANGYRELGRHQEAVELDEETLRMRERVLRPEHHDTLTSRNNLAVDYHQLGRYQEAVELDEETLRIRERVLGPEHPDTLTSRNNLAVDYRELGRYQEAEALFQRSQRIL
jgi:tetratricopeptide (TPR) repeat protein